MAKVKAQYKTHHTPPIDILQYVDDETGYGVELISEDIGLIDFECDDDTAEADAWFTVIATALDTAKDPEPVIAALDTLYRKTQNK